MEISSFLNIKESVTKQCRKSMALEGGRVGGEAAKLRIGIGKGRLG